MENNLSIKTIRMAYAHLAKRHQAFERTLKSKIGWKEKQLECLKKEEAELFLLYPKWTELLLRPLINEIKKHFPDWKCDDEKLTPMGIGSRVSIFLKRQENLKPNATKTKEKYIYITFIPGDLLKAELYYDTGKTQNQFASGTIGDINGFNNKTKEVESINELVEFLKKQIK